MPKNIIQYDLLISCPGDVVEEIDIIKEVVSEFNQRFSNVLGITIQTRHWSTSSYPQSGDKPQSILNEQFVKDCDAAVAIFWTRFGTPTDEFKSGSEEEIEIMIAAKKQVFLYFCEKPVKPGYDDKQYQLVQAFKNKCSDKVFYKTYDSIESFKALFFANLTQYFLSKKELDAIKLEKRPKLFLKSISKKGDIVDCAAIQKYVVPNPMNDEKRMERIQRNISILNESNLQKKQWAILPDSSGYPFARIKPVSPLKRDIKIDEDTKKIIINFSTEKKISLVTDFFDLGNLQEEIAATLASSAHGGGVVLKGTKEEKQKYQDIYNLRKEIEDYILWEEIEKTFSDLYTINLVVENAGSYFDEDVDIGVLFPASMIIKHDKLPKLDFFVYKHFIEEYTFLDLFSIRQTEGYANYDSAVKKRTTAPTLLRPSFIEKGNWFENKYQTELKETFCYTIFEKDDKCIVRLHMDYIKQHTVVAFPTPLFIDTTQLSEKITYQIVSKNNPDIVDGELFIRVDNSNI